MLVSGFNSIPSNSRFPASPTLFTLPLSWPSVEGSPPIPKYLFTNVSQCLVYGLLAYFKKLVIGSHPRPTWSMGDPRISILTTVPLILCSPKNEPPWACTDASAVGRAATLELALPFLALFWDRLSFLPAKRESHARFRGPKCREHFPHLPPSPACLPQSSASPGVEGNSWGLFSSRLRSPP